MSLFADYVREREGKEVLEIDGAFAIYGIQGPECYIQDVYVSPSLRRQGLASDIGDQIAAIAKEKGCKYLTGSVCPTANNSTASVQFLINYGMRVLRADNNMIWFGKEIK